MSNMAMIIDKIPNLPKRIPVLINKDKIVLPGCMIDFRIQHGSVKDLLKLKNKPNTTSIIVGMVHSGDVGTIGTATTVHSMYNVAQQYLTFIGLCRFRIDKLTNSTSGPFTVVEVTQIDKHDDCEDLRKDQKIVQLAKEIRNIVSDFIEYNSSSSFLTEYFSKIPPCYLAEICSHLINFTFDEKLKLLNSLIVSERLELTVAILNTKSKGDYKRPNIAVRSRPIGQQNSEYKKLEERINGIKFPSNVEALVQSELKELSMTTPLNPQYNILFSHLTLVADLPWTKKAEEILDLRKTKDDLEVDHYGLEEVKKRILEYLAVRKLRNTSDKSHKGPILCLVGPPGVGKTSIARSIAATLNLPMERVSLGGISNMSDIRGHRRAYIGAMPGRIIQAIRRSGVKNPLILLDEIDKMSYGAHGDPSAALLEVLDPSQNADFLDHYLNIPFDLSQVLFIGTANSVRKMSSALYDRLEIIRISGYTYLEKLQIANKYLLAKQLEETGLHSDKIKIPEETFRMLINNYTHEAGVRGLERKIGSLCRSVAVKIVLNETVDNQVTKFPIVIDITTAKDILGPMHRENNKWISRLGKPGVAVGLVVTSAGGGTIAVESSFMPGSGKLVLTGSLGDVMRESAQLAWGWVRSNAHMYGVELDGKKLNSIDVHVHFPEGAVNKDGPSAGVTVAATLMSLFLDRPLFSNVAMTGEITLQGLVLSVGGIKEKVIAAHKDGFTKIVIPQGNAQLLQDVPSNIKDDLTFVLVSDMHSIIETVFEDGVNLLIPHCAKSKL